MNTTYNRTPAPSHSIWGPVQQSTEIAPGWWQVSTAGHGGMILSPERLADIPAHLLADTFNKQGQRGSFEEDCDWCVPVLRWCEEFADHLKKEGLEPEKITFYLDCAGETFARYFTKSA